MHTISVKLVLKQITVIFKPDVCLEVSFVCGRRYMHVFGYVYMCLYASDGINNYWCDMDLLSTCH